MMGSRGLPPADPHVAAVSMLSDLIEAVKAADKTLPARVAEMRAAEAAAIAAQGELEKARAEHDARHAELDKRSAAADARDGALQARESAAAAKDAAAAERQADIDTQAAALAQRETATAAKEKAAHALAKSAQEDVRKGRAMIEQEKIEALEKLAAARRQAGQEMQAERENVAGFIAVQQAAADVDLKARWAALNKAEEEFRYRQQTAQEKARQLREALGQA